MKDEFAAFVRREGIYEAIETYDECGLDQKETIERIMKRYDLTRSKQNNTIVMCLLFHKLR